MMVQDFRLLPFKLLLQCLYFGHVASCSRNGSRARASGAYEGWRRRRTNTHGPSYRCLYSLTMGFAGAESGTFRPTRVWIATEGGGEERVHPKDVVGEWSLLLGMGG